MPKKQPTAGEFSLALSPNRDFFVKKSE